MTSKYFNEDQLFYQMEEIRLEDGQLFQIFLFRNSKTGKAIIITYPSRRIAKTPPIAFSVAISEVESRKHVLLLEFEKKSISFECQSYDTFIEANEWRLIDQIVNEIKTNIPTREKAIETALNHIGIVCFDPKVHIKREASRMTVPNWGAWS